MKKTKKRLALDAHTIKPLLPADAGDVQGGAPKPAVRCTYEKSGCGPVVSDGGTCTAQTVECAA